MGLDSLRRAANGARFDHVGIKRTLYEKINASLLALDLVGFFLKYRDELVADDATLLLRVRYPRKFRQEAFSCIYRDEVKTQLIAQVLLHFLKLVLAQHAIVDEYARKTIADCPINQRRSYGRVHASGECANCAAIGTNRLPHLLDCHVNEALRRPGRFRAGDVKREVAQNGGAEFGVVNFGMKLDGEHALFRILDRCHGVGGTPDQPKSRRQLEGFIAMRHPDGHSFWQASEQP